MKMSLPTVTQITKELIEKGFIAESWGIGVHWRKARKGAVTAAVNVRQAVGVDITKNHVGFVLTNLTGGDFKVCADCSSHMLMRMLIIVG